MNRITKSIGILIALSILIVVPLLSGCGSGGGTNSGGSSTGNGSLGSGSSTNAMVGTWQQTNGSPQDSRTYNPNGTGTTANGSTFTWRMDGDRIYTNGSYWECDGWTITWQNPNRHIVSGPNGQQYTWNRV